MTPERSALLLIGYQRDYFASDGVLRGALEDPCAVEAVLANTVALLRRVAPSSLTIISTPIMFTTAYEELIEPIGILKTIKDVGAFRAGTRGAETISAITQFGGRITEIAGKRGLNAFSNTSLDDYMRERGVTELALAGVVTSLCIDSTARSAFERGYRPVILSDCTAGRTAFEQKFYCESLFPLYARVMDHLSWMRSLGIE
jgi:nicotinamidase-related amidase